MKKTFWGYSIQEVDDNIGYLESQNIKLERQVKQLSSELEKAKNDLQNTQLNSEGSSEQTETAEKDRLISELEQKLSEAEKKNRELTSNSEELKAKINELSSANSAQENAAYDEVGKICQIAYADMHITKQKTKEHIEMFLKQFWKQWSAYEKQLAALSEQVKARQQEGRDSFISYADYILQTFGDMENSNRELDDNLSEIIGKKSKIEDSLNSLLSELDKDFDDERDIHDALPETETPDETETDDGKKYSILAAIKYFQKIHTDSETPSDAKAPQNAGVSANASPATETVYPNAKQDEMNISKEVNIRNII